MASDDHEAAEAADPTPPGRGLTGGIDLTPYDLAGLRADLVNLVSFPDLAFRTIRYAALGPIVVGVVTWLYFGGRMDRFSLVVFTLLAMAFSLLASALIAIYIVMRQHVGAATKASSRVIDTLTLAQEDLQHAAEAGRAIDVRAVTDELLQTVVFPALHDGAAAAVPLPFRLLAKPVLWLPRSVMEKTVMGVVDLVAGRAQLGAGSLGNSMARAGNVFDSIPDGLRRAQENLEQRVERVMRLTLRPLVVFVVLSLIPLALWIAIGHTEF